MGKVTEETNGAVVTEQPADKKVENGSCGCGCNSGTKGK
jgi:hypothetical protein